MRQVGVHDVIPFRPERNATLDTLRWAKKRLTVTSLLEVNVTAARQAKNTMGTVVVTATGMTAPGVLAWGIPLSLHPLAIGVGGIARRSTGAGEADILALSLVFDHAVTDGAPVGRFVRRLTDLLSGTDGLG